MTFIFIIILPNVVRTVLLKYDLIQTCLLSVLIYTVKFEIHKVDSNWYVDLIQNS